MTATVAPEEEKTVSNGDTTIEAPAKKKRNLAAKAPAAKEKKRPGRPKGSKNKPKAEVAKKKPGRPKKIMTAVAKRGPGRPPKSEARATNGRSKAIVSRKSLVDDPVALAVRLIQSIPRLSAEKQALVKELIAQA